MKFFLPIIFLQFMSLNVLGHWIQQERIDYDDELTYQELVNLNGSCYPFNSCTEYRIDQPFAPASSYHCSCHEQCWEFGMCCIDSPYRFKPQIQSCRNVGVTRRTDNVYMVDRCPYNTNSDSIWKSQCENEWNGEDDILMLSPVTSMDTSRTYKNYYCFKCHESTDNYISWDLSVDSTYIYIPEEKNIYSVSYNQGYQIWEATLEENGVPFPANLSFQYPRDLQVQPVYCSKNKIDDCPDTWTDGHVREKCLAYAAFIFQGYSSYKNVHCALCNYESLDALTCIPTIVSAFGKEYFSFRNLLNINDSDGDKVGKKGKCDEDHTWDPYSKKCRKKTCAIPGFVIKNDRCVPP